MWSHDVVATSIGLAGDLKLGQYLKVSVVCFGIMGLDVHRVPKRFLLVLCFYLRFGERLLVCFRINSVDVRNLMLSVARGYCELWCVPWGTCPSSRANGSVIT